MKKLLLVFMSFTLVFIVTSFSASSEVGAKPSRSYKSPTGGYNAPSKQAPAPAKDTNVSKTTDPSRGTNPAPANRGFFSGGGLMKGLLIGGIAGMLFGGLFGNMGVLGNIFGFLINIIAIIAVIMLIRMAVMYFIKRRKENELKRS